MNTPTGDFYTKFSPLGVVDIVFLLIDQMQFLLFFVQQL